MSKPYYFINQYGWPDGAATAQLLCDVLRAGSASRTVFLVQSRKQYLPAPADNSQPNVDIIRLWGPDVGRESKFPKLLGFLAFYVQVVWVMFARARGSDLVVMTTPPFLSVLGALSKVVRGGHLISWEMDVYPEILYSTGIVSEASWLGSGIKVLVGWARRWTDLTVVLGPCMARLVVEGGVRRAACEELHNWADGEKLYPTRTPGAGSSLKLLYSGNLGVAHDVDTIAAALDSFKGRPIEFVFAGGGVGTARVRKYEREMVRFQGPCAHDELNVVLNEMDIGLVTQTRASLGCVVPSKFYGIVAAGRGVLYVGPEESTVAQVIRETGCGWTVGEGDSEGLVRLVLELEADRQRVRQAGEISRRVFEERFSKEKGVARFWELLASLDEKQPK